MQDFSPILNHIDPHIALTEEEKEIFLSVLSIRQLRRKQFIDQPGFISQHRNYVVKGAFRSYLIGSDGQEYTIALALEDSFVGDHGSFLSQEPATLFVEALEDSLVIQISHEGEQLLLEKIPKFHSYLRIRAQYTAVSIQKRVLSAISQTAEQRYIEFEKEHPHYLQRFPLYMIASYLGMTREFLSKIRNSKTNPTDNVN